MARDYSVEIEEAFGRYMSLDPDELDAAAEQARERDAEERSRRFRRARRDGYARPAERPERTLVDDSALAWAEALSKARSAGEGDVAGRALGRALEGDPSGFLDAMRKAASLTQPELEAQIANAEELKSLLGDAGMATFRLKSFHPLSVAQLSASAAVSSVDVVLRGELAKRLSRADAGLNTKSTRNRARRAREWEERIPEAQQSYRDASLTLPGVVSDGLGGAVTAARATDPAARGSAPAPSAPEGRAREIRKEDDMARGEEGSKRRPASKETGRTVKVSFPSGWVHPYKTKPDGEGAVRDRAVANIPSGCEANGVSLDGYSVDVPLQDFHKKAIAEGRPVTFSFREDRQVRLFSSGKPDLSLNPWALTKAVKQGREAFRAKRESAAAPSAPGVGVVRITFPAAWAQPVRTRPDADGTVRDMAVVRMPSGTVLSGRALDGYLAAVPLQDFHKKAIAEGRPVTFSFREDRQVRLFSEGRPDIRADPWMLSTALKAGREVPAAAGSGQRARTPDSALKRAAGLNNGVEAPAKTPKASK